MKEIIKKNKVDRFLRALRYCTVLVPVLSTPLESWSHFWGPETPLLRLSITDTPEDILPGRFPFTVLGQNEVLGAAEAYEDPCHPSQCCPAKCPLKLKNSIPAL